METFDCKFEVCVNVGLDIQNIGLDTVFETCGTILLPLHMSVMHLNITDKWFLLVRAS